MPLRGDLPVGVLGVALAALTWYFISGELSFILATLGSAPTDVDVDDEVEDDLRPGGRPTVAPPFASDGPSADGRMGGLLAAAGGSSAAGAEARLSGVCGVTRVFRAVATPLASPPIGIPPSSAISPLAAKKTPR